MGETLKTDDLEAIAAILLDRAQPLKERFRALFSLKNVGGKVAVDSISKCFDDPSSLLKHECAYCLGQMQDESAIPTLLTILADSSQEPIVRHEAGEALGAIGSNDVLPILEKYKDDPIIEIAETCQLAIERIQWLKSQQSSTEKLSENPYCSVDPAPPSVETDVRKLRADLLDEELSLYARYRAMFALRNIGSEECVLALADGLQCKSALFRHEVAYVLGQMQHPAGAEALTKNLKDSAENSMVRHECAEALGSIATDSCMTVLKDHLKDTQRVVKESCEVALDMGEYQTSEEFQYATVGGDVSRENGV